MSYNTFGEIAGIFSAIAFLLYYASIVGIIKVNGERTIPNRATWIGLTAIGTVIASTAWSSGSRETMWIPVTYILGPFIVFLLGFKYGENKWHVSDKICLVGTLAIVACWVYTGQSLLGLILGIVADSVSMYPTIKKTYSRPWTEYKIAWAFTFVASATNVLAVREVSLELYLYPVYMIVVNGITFLLTLNFQRKEK